MEVADGYPDLTPVRDSKNPDGPPSSSPPRPGRPSSPPPPPASSPWPENSSQCRRFGHGERRVRRPAVAPTTSDRPDPARTRRLPEGVRSRPGRLAGRPSAGAGSAVPTGLATDR
ncbi:hypothetical protein [Kitasatospora herbaricolor]|uniref:hypothetical protein n=1 Tax=Kitasatospora herbaricolor TaxID=68217 RepID=UPI003521605D